MKTIMVNCNPETVSTDYDTSDKLYFEPLTFEDFMNIYENEKPDGVIVQMGGQTPLSLAVPLQDAGVPIWGTSPDSIDRAEDRKRCRELLDKLGLRQPESAAADSVEEALAFANDIGYPVMIRPSYVLGGRAMIVAHDGDELVPYAHIAFRASPNFPVLIDRYLEGAIEVDVDIVCDGTDVCVGGVMEHVEAAGVHSGDSACAIPPHTLSQEMQSEIEDACCRIAKELNVRGLMNAQIAVKDNEFYIIEINPRASRTVPYLAKATGVPLAKIAASIAAGKTLREFGLVDARPKMAWCAVKEAVLPFARFAGVDPVLGPEMKSTGEVMGIDSCFEAAYWKSQIAAGQHLPEPGGMVFLSAKESDKPWMVEVGQQLAELGFKLVATEGTANTLEEAGLQPIRVRKLTEKQSTNILDYMTKDEVWPRHQHAEWTRIQGG